MLPGCVYDAAYRARRSLASRDSVAIRSHDVVLSAEALEISASGCRTTRRALLPVFIGNSIGGIGLVSLLKYGEVTADANESLQTL
jgi:formate/nitrite transporter FocA (FNT family)